MTDTLIQRLSDEADLCRNDGATDVAKLLDDAVYALVNQAARLAAAEIVSAQPAAPAAAAPSVVPEPLFLLHSGQIDSGGEQDDWETEADSQVRVDEFCRLHPGQTIPLFAHPPRAPLTEEQVTEVYEVSSGQPLRPQDKESVFAFAYAIEAAHGIGGK